ncbi:MAG: ABC transporter permease subunit [Ruminiclostridium sp.]|nr:ABC transporter permease subunit [Ruminiclostridium sp.]
MNIFLHEFKSNFKSAMIWALSMLLLALIFILIYPGFAQGKAEMKNLFAGYPPQILKAFGFDLSIIFSPLGFYSLVFQYIVLCGSIQAMVLGCSLISKEFTKKTADFLMTKPVSRVSVISAKTSAGLSSLIITYVLVVGLTWVLLISLISQPIDFGAYMKISITFFLIEMMFFAIGVFVAVTVRKVKSVTGISIGIVVGFFVLGLLVSSGIDVDLRYLVPFKYYDYIKILGGNGFELNFVIINILFVLITISVSYVIYIKSDIHAA